MKGIFFHMMDDDSKKREVLGGLSFLAKEDNEYGGVVYENVFDGALVIPRNSNSPQYVTRSGDHEQC